MEHDFAGRFNNLQGRLICHNPEFVGFVSHAPDKFYKGRSQEKTLLRWLKLSLLLSPRDGAGSVLTARTSCSVAGHRGPAI
jgi:hypothetical protein